MAYLTNFKTILPLVIFWSGHFLNFFSQKNLLLGPNQPMFFMWAPRLCPQWTFLRTKFSKSLKFRSYIVKFFIFVWLISHWLMLVGQCAIWLCDGYDQITLDARTKIGGSRPYLRFLWIFFKIFIKSKTPWRGHLLRYLNPLKCILGHV